MTCAFLQLEEMIKTKHLPRQTTISNTFLMRGRVQNGTVVNQAYLHFIQWQVRFPTVHLKAFTV